MIACGSDSRYVMDNQDDSLWVGLAVWYSQSLGVACQMNETQATHVRSAEPLTIPASIVAPSCTFVKSIWCGVQDMRRGSET